MREMCIFLSGSEAAQLGLYFDRNARLKRKMILTEMIKQIVT